MLLLKQPKSPESSKTAVAKAIRGLKALAIVVLKTGLHLGYYLGETLLFAISNHYGNISLVL